MMSPVIEFARKQAITLGVAGVLVVHVLLLVWSAYIHSPTNGEVSALAAGIYHWQEGKFDLFRVNPPLVRMIAAVPVLFCEPQTDWSLNHDRLANRDEFPVGIEFIRLNGEKSFFYFTLARLACIPFSLLGAIVCFLWARELYGTASGFAALFLWCFSPTILGHASTIGPDAHAAACGLFACYMFWRWLKSPSVSQTLFTGLALGLAELTKSTWIILFPLWLCLWVSWRIARKSQNTKPSLGSLCLVFLTGLLCINFGYGGERMFQPLGQFRFISTTFGGETTETNNKMKGKNRFIGTPLESLPVPLPQNYVLGIDIQRSDFEFQSKNYLLGKWQHGGWWYYYLVAFLVKEPVALSLLLLLSAFLLFRRFVFDEVILLVPAIVVFLLVSSQMGMNQHYRYALGALPFLFIFASKVATVRLRAFRILSFILVGWYGLSSLAIFPHNLSYFNEVVGGSRYGHRYLLGSNLEWGQDVLLLKKWADKYPNTRPLFVDQTSYFDVSVTGLESDGLPQQAFVPGWYALGVNRLCDRESQYRYFLNFEPVARAGYSIYIYHLTQEDVERVYDTMSL
jgi:hypothetical protein